MIKRGDIVLVAFSGGPDSLFLLHALLTLKSKLKIREIVVCNLDHGLRGRESRNDSLFVKRVAAEHNLKYLHKKIDLKKRLLLPSGIKFGRDRNDGRYKDLSTEELARKARYNFFDEAAAKTGANVIATGHTLDDQAETILMRLIKGSALKGIVGISPVREAGRLRIIRPLIEIEKCEITRYLDEKKVAYRVDSTNAKPIYFRNVVRGEIIPFLERYNPRLKRVLFNLAEHLREDFEFISEEKARIQKKIVRGAGPGVEIKLKDIIIQPSAIQKEILRDSLDRCGGEVKKLSFRHWKELEALLKYGTKGKSIDLPGSVRASRTESLLVLRIPRRQK